MSPTQRKILHESASVALIRRPWPELPSFLPRRHVTAHPTPTEMIRPALRTEILLPKTPHLFSRLARALPESVLGLFAAEDMPATTHTFGPGNLTLTLDQPPGRLRNPALNKGPESRLIYRNNILTINGRSTAGPVSGHWTAKIQPESSDLNGHEPGTRARPQSLRSDSCS